MRIASTASEGGDLIANSIEHSTRQAPRRVHRVPKSPRKTRLYYTLGPKGGIGKSFACRALIDLLMTLGTTVRAVQVDRGTSLTSFYPDLTRIVHVPSADDMRAKPLSAISAFAPLEETLEACVAEGSDLVVDVGAGQNAKIFAEFFAKARFDPYLARHGIRPTALLLVTADPSAMAQSVDFAEVLAAAHPHAEIIVALNERDGPFSFRSGTQAHRVWTERMEGLLAGKQRVTIPAMAIGAWPMFEGHGMTFRQIVEADERDLAARLGESRAIAATLQGDVSEWVEAVWSAFTPLVTETTGGVDG